MTIGTGVFLSTVLLVCVWAALKITAHKKWRLAGKVAGACVAIPCVLGASYYLWNYVASLPPRPSVVTQLDGIKLGMSPTDVTLVLGKPDWIALPTVENGETKIAYSYSDANMQVTFFGSDKYHVKASIICSSADGATLLGFGNYSSEESVVKILGKPTRISVARDGLSKVDSFSEWKAAFVVTKGQVTQKCVTSTGFVVYAEEALSPDAQKAADEKAAADARAERKAADEKTAADALAVQKAVEEETTREKMAQKRVQSDLPEGARVRLKAAADASALHSEPNAPPPYWASASNLDPCAPDISKAERLRRLAASGNIRQTGMDSYSTGGHSIVFLGSSLLSCF